jgi:predicted Zn-dependent protease
MEEQLRRLTAMVDLARRQGALGSEFLYTEQSGNGIDMVRGQPLPITVPSTSGLRVSTWLEGGRKGVAVGSVERGAQLIGASLAEAANAPENAHSGPVGRLAGKVGGLGVFDRRYGALTAPDRQDVLVAAVRTCAAVDRRLQPHGFTYRDRLTTRCFANSKGTQLSETETTYTATGAVRGLLEDGEVEADTVIAARSFSSIASLPFGNNLARRVEALFQEGETLDGPVRVMLAPHACARLFAHLATYFEVRSFMDGTFFLQPDGPPLHRKVHLVDDGTLPGGLLSRSFDDRGVKPVPLTLLREGRVEGRFLDPETARRIDSRPTGHEVGGTRGPSNLVLRSGTRSMNALLSEMGGWSLMIRYLPPLAGAINPRTGKMTCTVSGVVMKGNQAVGAVRNRTLTGDLKEVLAQVVHVASDTDRVCHVDAPGMLVDGFVLS